MNDTTNTITLEEHERRVKEAVAAALETATEIVAKPEDIRALNPDHHKTIAQIEARGMRKVFNDLQVYSPVLVDGPEHDVGYYYGYITAMNRILALADEMEGK